MKMPQLEPILIPTKGLSFFKSAWALVTSVRKWRVTQDWEFTLYNGVVIKIPAGFEFDGASIPKPIYMMAGAFLLLLFVGIEISPLLMLILSALFMLSGLLLSPIGIMLIAGLIHDYAYANGHLLYVDGSRYDYKNGCRLDYDDLFLRTNLQVNGVIYADYIAAGLLKIFGGIAWEQHRQRRANQTPNN